MLKKHAASLICPSTPISLRPIPAFLAKHLGIAFLGLSAVASPVFAAAYCDAYEYQQLSAVAAQKGYVRVMVNLDVDVSLDTIRQHRQALASQLALKADALLAEIGSDALRAGFWQNGVGQLGIYVTPAGLEKLKQSPHVREISFDSSESQRASVDDDHGQIAAIEAQIDRKGYADVDVVLNLENVAFEMTADGETVFIETPALQAEVTAALPVFEASLETTVAPAQAQVIDDGGVQAEANQTNQFQKQDEPSVKPGKKLKAKQRLRVTREGLYALKEHPQLRSIRLANAGQQKKVLTAAELDPEALEHAREQGSADVLIGLRAPVGYSAWEGKMGKKAWTAQDKALKKAFAEALAPLSKDELIHTSYFDGLPLVSARLSLTGLERLYKNPDARIRSVTLNKAFAVPALAQSTAWINAPQAWNKGFTAAGQTIAIIDTGVAKNHPFLKHANGQSKVIFEACFSGRTITANTMGNNQYSLCPNADPTSGDSPLGMVGSADWALNPPFADGLDHGTHVAGIAAGRRGWNGLSGMAPDANIIAVQVFTGTAYVNPYGNGQLTNKNFTVYPDDYVKALQTVAANTGTSGEITVNMSLGGVDLNGPSGSCRYTYELGEAINQLLSKKIPVVAATGNNGRRDRISSPACVPGVTKVAATVKGSDILWVDSNIVNPATLGMVETMLLAPGAGSSPGTGIVSATLPAVSGATRAASGTSMAAPHVSGIYAALKAANPGTSVANASAWIKNNFTVNASTQDSAGNAIYPLKSIRLPNF